MTDYVCILDFEATCWKENGNHEIIEFPSVLLKWNGTEVVKVSEFQQYVKPKINPTVSEFCREKLGITQEQVDNGIGLMVVMNQHIAWLKTYTSLENVTIVTCGDWDLKVMLPMDLKNFDTNEEEYKLYKRFVNIKKIFQEVHKTPHHKYSMKIMLYKLNMTLDGRHHSGIDDCRNICKIFINLVENGLDKTMFLGKVTEL